MYATNKFDLKHLLFLFQNHLQPQQLDERVKCGFGEAGCRSPIV